MDTIARPVCLDAGGGTFMQGEDVEIILKVLRNYLKPGTDRIYQQETKFPRNKSDDQTTGRCILEFDVLRRKTEARALMGTAAPATFVRVLRTQHAAARK